MNSKGTLVQTVNASENSGMNSKGIRELLQTLKASLEWRVKALENSGTNSKDTGTNSKSIRKLV